jgi:hypothetical protein
MRSHVHKAATLNEARPPLAPAPAPKPAATPPAPSYYDSIVAAGQRRAEKLALDKHTTPTLSLREQRKQLKSRIAALQRELQPIETELATLRRQLLTLN